MPDFTPEERARWIQDIKENFKSKKGKEVSDRDAEYILDNGFFQSSPGEQMDMVQDTAPDGTRFLRLRRDTDPVKKLSHREKYGHRKEK